MTLNELFMHPTPNESFWNGDSFAKCLLQGVVGGLALCLAIFILVRWAWLISTW